MNDNNITGTIPVEIANMNLGYGGLKLNGNKMSGEIPAKVLSSAVWKKLYPETISILSKKDTDSRMYNNRVSFY